MTPDEEDAEIIRNARAAREAGEITQDDLHTVYLMVARSKAERTIWKQSE